MPKGLTEIRQRISATRQMSKVASALRMVASARLAEGRDLMESSTRYADRLGDVLCELCYAIRWFEHPLLAEGRHGSTAVIVFGSERGLCGGFNRLLMEKLEDFVGARGDDVRLTVMGRILARRAARAGMNIDRLLEQPREPAAVAEAVRGIMSEAVDAFAGGEWREVYVLYSRFISGSLQVPTLERVLPVSFGTREPSGKWLASGFEPDIHTIVERLLPEFVYMQLYTAFVNSSGSENAARQSSMGRASDNAEELLSEQLMSYRRLRQESITTQIIEIATGLQKSA